MIVRAALCLAALLASTAPAFARALLDPLTARVTHAPVPIQGDDGKTRLVYELEIVNVADRPTTVTRIEVNGPSSQAWVVEAAEVAANFRRYGSKSSPKTLTLDSGVAGLIYMELLLTSDVARGPLAHRLTVETGEGADREVRAIDLASLALSTMSALQIGPPVRGGPWWVNNGPSNVSGHRRLPIPLNGRATIYQRYAIDYIKLDSQGRQLVGDQLDNRSYFTEGQEVIAVADATVVVAIDGLAENLPGKTPQGDALNLGTVTGNTIVLALGEGQYAIYAHLLPGSVRVKKGDTVRLGQTLARIGNTGNSILPHLHFQLADTPDSLSGEGLPYTHAGFEWLGKCAKEDGPCTLQAPQMRRDALPLNQSIVRSE